MFSWLRDRLMPTYELGAGPDRVALVAGLGNPGTEYIRTRHNVGFLALNRLAERHHTPIKKAFRRSLTGSWRSPSGEVILAQPQTFMNNSGESLAAIARFYRLKPSQILVVCDDVNLPFGKIRVRRDGSEGGHNGLRSISNCLGSREYGRIRVGIGAVPPRWKLTDYVLGSYTAKELDELSPVLDRVAETIETTLRDGIQAAMNRFNGGES